MYKLQAVKLKEVMKSENVRVNVRKDFKALILVFVLIGFQGSFAGVFAAYQQGQLKILIDSSELLNTIKSELSLLNLEQVKLGVLKVVYEDFKPWFQTEIKASDGFGNNYKASLSIPLHYDELSNLFQNASSENVKANQKSFFCSSVNCAESSCLAERSACTYCSASGNNEPIAAQCNPIKLSEFDTGQFKPFNEAIANVMLILLNRP